MSAASFLHSCFLQAINAVMLWPVHVQKVLKPRSASALVSCRPDIISAVIASLSARSFPLTPACPGQLIHRSLCSRRLSMVVSQSGQPIPDSTFCRRFIESVKMMACVICASRWEASRCVVCLPAPHYTTRPDEAGLDPRVSPSGGGHIATRPPMRHTEWTMVVTVTSRAAGPSAGLGPSVHHSWEILPRCDVSEATRR